MIASFSSPSAFDRAMMQRCLTLARQALGCTAPNPMVGAVIVKDGEIVGEGFHPKAGEPHAEVFALREAGDRARGATAYVSLEPCNHFGRTPPCSRTLVRAGITKVVVGTVDPNPQVAGRGIQTLRDAGIEVVVGVEEADCQAINEGFIHRILCRRPFGILKYAMTLDGKIASSTGHSTWVSGTPARSQVHHLRHACDAVIVGGNTVRHDNPRLTCRADNTAPNPLRVVLSRSLDLPDEAQLWRIDQAPTLVITQTGVRPEFQAQLRDRGVEVVEVETVRPSVAMELLYERGALSVLWECGGTLAARAIAEGSVQKVIAFIAPKIIGGVEAPHPVGDLGIHFMTNAIALERIRGYAVGEDWAIEGYLPSTDWRP
ncbi:MAG: bifunctional diaminohydroxyphosphoribosylaminopyrimidine deaminase/5-amino-6-(5-phosphoribosylamino)uracil reductase RibD [Oscillatoriales cyanobacterium]|nr:MAG: bifunctional diaminohydroxyphosphoribosylaminopyrimidine deaminase/5-amino-6-(5-phosphoribosylamino)uracil reductase RibD [Oscillatoriales cyanobacterium]